MFLWLGPFLRALGQYPSAKELQHIKETIDLHGDGTFQYAEFVEWYRMRKALFKTDQLVEGICGACPRFASCNHNVLNASELFRFFDRDGNGYISKKELMERMGEVGANLTDEEAYEMVRFLDNDFDGQISRAEFKVLALDIL